MNSKIAETDRLVVRELTIEDSELLYQYSNEDSAKRELADEVLADENCAKCRIKEFINNYRNTKMPLVYGIELKDSRKLIGQIELSAIDKGIELGYSIASAYQNKGYCSEIVNPFIMNISKSLGITELYGIAKSENINSWKILENSGFILVNDGCFEQYFCGKYRVKVYIKEIM
jgi:ribosomal-protein-alanine N-acetyltransferase